MTLWASHASGISYSHIVYQKLYREILKADDFSSIIIITAVYANSEEFEFCLLYKC